MKINGRKTVFNKKILKNVIRFHKGNICWMFDSTATNVAVCTIKLFTA
jgi:hypothetical protein